MSNKIIKTIGDRIKEMREQRGLKQNEVSKALGMSAAVFSRYENNQRIFYPELLSQLADFYDVSVDELLGRE